MVYESTRRIWVKLLQQFLLMTVPRQFLSVLFIIFSLYFCVCFIRVLFCDVIMFRVTEMLFGTLEYKFPEHILYFLSSLTPPIINIMICFIFIQEESTTNELKEVSA